MPSQAGRLLADEQAGYSAVFTGTIDRPVLIGPEKISYSIGTRLQLVVDEARRTALLQRAGIAIPVAPIERVVTAQAAGNLQMIRRLLAQSAQGVIFVVTLLLATLLLSNLAEEKSNKVIEVLAAAVPLDAVFLGKLIAMLGISLVGLSLWGGMLGLAYLFWQVVQDWVTLPQVGPAVGWPVFLALLLVYYAVNYMLLGALFLGIGGQASNIREIQTLSMPVTMLQVFVFLLAMTAVGRESGAVVLDRLHPSVQLAAGHGRLCIQARHLVAAPRRPGLAGDVDRDHHPPVGANVPHDRAQVVAWQRLLQPGGPAQPGRKIERRSRVAAGSTAAPSRLCAPSKISSMVGSWHID